MKPVRTAGLVFGLLLGVACAPAAADAGQFQKANELYDKGDFKAAAQAYEEIDPKTAAVYYNLGNANFRLGKKATALLSYERALRVVPRDKDAQWNLEVLKGVLTDRLSDNDNLLTAGVKHAAGWVTANEAAILFSTGLGLFLLAALAGALLPGAGFLRGLLRTSAYLLTLAAGILFYFKWVEIKDAVVVVLDKQVYAHYGPSPRETKAFLLHEGALAKKTDEVKDWVQVTLPDKTAGWVPKKSVEIV